MKKFFEDLVDVVRFGVIVMGILLVISAAISLPITLGHLLTMQ